MKFNRNKPFGTISPPWQGAMYQQGDHYYDIEFRRIPALSAKPKLREIKPVDVSPPGSVEADLIRMADDPNSTWQEFRKQARDVLDNCPSTKEKIVEALKEQIINGVMDISPAPAVVRAEVEVNNSEEFKGMTWDEKPAPPPESEADEENDEMDEASVDSSEEDMAEPNDGPVNLALWGQGKANYLFSDVRMEIRNRFSRQVTEKRDAIDTLVDEGVIAVGDAMSVE